MNPGFLKWREKNGSWNRGLTKETAPQIERTGFKIGHPVYPGCERGWFKTERVGGSNNVNWKGGVTPLVHKIRNSTEYNEWRDYIFKRDDYTCQDCKKRGVYLHAHHIRGFAEILEVNNIKSWENALGCKELWDTSNGIALCRECHKRKTWGGEN